MQLVASWTIKLASMDCEWASEFESSSSLPYSCTPDQHFSCFYTYEIIFSHIPTHTRSSDPYLSSLSEKSVPHRYPCEISVTNTR